LTSQPSLIFTNQGRGL